MIRMDSTKKRIFRAALHNFTISLVLFYGLTNYCPDTAHAEIEPTAEGTVVTAESPRNVPQNCKFDYWQLIPDDVECDVFYLPDFDFRRLPEDPKVDIRLKRFCENFEIRYGINSKVISYCKDPNKDGSGPSFDIDGTSYHADIYFEGCYNGKNTYGKVFTNKSWTDAPKHIKRIWRIKNKNSQMPDCKM